MKTCRHALDVEAACGDVGGDQDRQLAAAKARQHAFARILHQVAGDAGSLDAGQGDALHRLLDRQAGAGEDQGAAGVQHLEQADERRHLAATVGDDEMLRHMPGGLAHVQAHLLGMVEPALDRIFDRGREGRAEQPAGDTFAEVLDQRIELLTEAHVEHLIGLVEDQDLGVALQRCPCRDGRAHAPGRADHQGRMIGEFTGLLAPGRAADQRGDLAHAEHQGGLARHLLGQLTGRAHHPDALAPVLADACRHRQQVGEGLARAGPGLRQQIAAALAHAGQGQRDDGGLHRRGC